jgi:hypothetical protein
VKARTARSLVREEESADEPKETTHPHQGAHALRCRFHGINIFYAGVLVSA